MNKQDSLTNFLRRTQSSKEVSLMIAKDDDEQLEFQKILEQEGFRKIDNVQQLLGSIASAAKIHLMAGDSLRKDLYDFIIQYPTSQVQIFDKQSLNSKVINPRYKNVSIVLVITKYHLEQVQKQGFDILRHTGLTYQN